MAFSDPAARQGGLGPCSTTTHCSTPISTVNSEYPPWSRGWGTQSEREKYTQSCQFILRNNRSPAREWNRSVLAQEGGIKHSSGIASDMDALNRDTGFSVFPWGARSVLTWSVLTWLTKTRTQSWSIRDEFQITELYWSLYREIFKGLGRSESKKRSIIEDLLTSALPIEQSQLTSPIYLSETSTKTLRGTFWYILTSTVIYFILAVNWVRVRSVI